MANFQVRGCCCGIPFGFGTVIVALLGFLLWKLAAALPDLVALVPPLFGWAAGVVGLAASLAPHCLAGRGRSSFLQSFFTDAEPA